jgi:hypothetical protein
VDTAGNTAYSLSNAISGIDTTAPTAAITYSVAGPYKSGALVTITATFSEVMATSPIPKISISGANTLLATNMTQSSSTVYTYAYIVGSGNGVATVAMNTGTDLAGNIVTSAPTSGATFTVDNTPPTVTWIYPLPSCNGTIPYCNVYNQTIQLTVNASDTGGSGISKVVFQRWDKVALLWIEIRTIYNSPYSFTFDASVLLPNLNEIDVLAYDGAGNWSESYIFVNHINLWQIYLPLISRK